jgi:hypothetical protein
MDTRKKESKNSFATKFRNYQKYNLCHCKKPIEFRKASFEVWAKREPDIWLLKNRLTFIFFSLYFKNMIITVLASFLLLVQHIIALSINIKAGEVDCYYEYLEVGEKLIVSYQVKIYNKYI